MIRSKRSDASWQGLSLSVSLQCPFLYCFLCPFLCLSLQGGACKRCGEKTHLAKDCPKKASGKMPPVNGHPPGRLAQNGSSANSNGTARRGGYRGLGGKTTVVYCTLKEEYSTAVCNPVELHCAVVGNTVLRRGFSHLGICALCVCFSLAVLS